MLGGTLGFGVSQLTIVAEVKSSSVTLNHTIQSNREVHERLMAELEAERKRTDARIFEVVGQVREQMSVNRSIVDQNRELISQNKEMIALLRTTLSLKDFPP